MKKAILFIILALVFSCNLNDDLDEVNVRTVSVPIQSAEFPDFFEFGQTYNITFNYSRPSNCHHYYDLYYVAEENVRTIAALAYLEVKDDCEPLIDENLEGFFNFKVLQREGSYIFKFWQGEDANGEDIFVTYEVPVQ